jgi:uncharacterized membrane protein
MPADYRRRRRPLAAGRRRNEDDIQASDPNFHGTSRSATAPPSPEEDADSHAERRSLLKSPLAGLPRPTLFQVLFLAYVIAALVIFTALAPPFQKSDEPAHYFRAISLANLQLSCSRDQDGEYYFLLRRRHAELPDVMRYWEVWHREMRFDWAWLRHDFSDPVYDEQVRVYRWCSLPPFGYLPNAAGVLLGMPFQNPLYGFYLGRALGALLFVGAIVVALRITPDLYRPAVYLYAAIPTVLHQVSSFNYDVVQLSLFPLIFAMLARFIAQPMPLKKGHFIAFLALLAWTLNARLVAYYPMLLLAYAVPWRNQTDGSSGRFSPLVAGALTVAALFTLTVAFAYLPRAEDSGPGGDYEVNASEQVRFVIQNPWRFLEASYNAVARYGDHLVGGGIGSFGWIDYGMAFLPYYAFAVATGALVFYTASRDQPHLRPTQLLALAGALTFTVLFIFLSLYAVWSPIGGDMVQGVQGRYFIGLLPFVVLLVSQAAAVVGRQRLAMMILLLVALMLLYNIYRAIEFRHL